MSICLYVCMIEMVYNRLMINDDCDDIDDDVDSDDDDDDTTLPFEITLLSIQHLCL